MDPLSAAIAFMAFGSQMTNGLVNVGAQQDANRLNMDIAKMTNDTNIQNTRETNKTILDAGRATNDANIRIAQDTNRANAALAAADRAAQLDQWKRETAYNTPAMQSARLRSAGLNPALAAGDAGNASSLSLRSSDPNIAPTLTSPATGITAPQATAVPNITAPQFGMDTAIGSALDSIMALKNIERAHTDNTVAKATAYSRILEAKENAEKAGYESDAAGFLKELRKLEFEVKKETKDDDVQQARAQTKRQINEADKSAEDVESARLANERQRLENEFLSKYHGYELKKAQFEIRQLNQAISLAAKGDARAAEEHASKMEIMRKDIQAKRLAVNTLAEEFKRTYDKRFYYIDKDGNKVMQSKRDIQEILENSPFAKLCRALGISSESLIDKVMKFKP